MAVDENAPFNPFDGYNKQVLTRELSKYVVLAQKAQASNQPWKVHYYLGCAYDVVAILHPELVDGA